MHRMNCIATASVVMLAAAASHAAIIAAWDFSPLPGGSNNFGPSPLSATSTGSNISVGGLTRGSGIGTTGTGSFNAWGGNDFTGTDLASAITNNEFATFTVTTNSGFKTSFSDFAAYNIRRSGTGPTTGIFQYQIGAGSFTSIGSAITWGATTSASGNPQSSIDLSGISALQNVAAGTTVTFRIATWGASGTGGTWYLNDPADTTANDFVLNGATTAVNANPTVTVSPSSLTVDVSPPGLEGFSGVTVSASDTDGSVVSLVPGTIPAQIADNISIVGSGGGPLSVSGSGFTYADLGSYNISFTATDNAGGTDVKNFTLNVVPEPASLAAIAGLGLVALRRRRSA